MGRPTLDPSSTADRLAAAGERVTRQRLLSPTRWRRSDDR